MIAVEHATKRKGTRALWDALSFAVGPGEMVAVTGPSGSGKSTLLDCIGRLDDVDSGTITVGGVVAGTSRRTDRLLRRDVIGYLFQNYGLVEDASVGANLDIVRTRRSTRSERRPSNEAALETVGLGRRGSRPVAELSGGEQQRVALARLIVKQPTVILADEPTAALDDDNGRMVMDVLAQFAERGAAVLIATHVAAVRDACARTVDFPGPTD